ncbi:MAG TPA: preprotein translocase subunit SecG [Clostridiales bacterium]|jgi:preprotein translocase subunit SecG|nr:preprotein translocase subunit SecG [Clostridiales bacterium]
MKLTLQIIQVLCSLALVLVVLFQSGNKQGLGVIGGAADNFVSKNKSKSMDAKLQKITILVAIIFSILTVILNLPGVVS